jgi:hypothetical protein
MKVRFTPSWELTDERAESSYGQPVLVERRTGKAFGPGDLLEPYAHWGLESAAVHVTRMSSMKKLSSEDLEFVGRFKMPEV